MSRDRFSHIYVELRAMGYPLTERVLSSHPRATIVPIERYRSVFDRPRQDYSAQKQSAKLILAVKPPPFLYTVSDNCQTFGFERSFYAATVFGCPFDCDYCFLRGMYPSANIVLFVNTEDAFAAAQEALAKTRGSSTVQINLSYDTDLMAWEGEFGICREWISFAENSPNLVMEIRTRSAGFAAIRGLAPRDNVKLAFSLSPQHVVRRYEHKAPSFEKRLSSLAAAAAAGWPVRIAIDPVIPVPSWREAYGDMISRIFETVPKEAVEGISLGPFRASRAHIKRMKRSRPDLDLFGRQNEISTEDLESFAEAHLLRHVEEERIEIWRPPRFP